MENKISITIEESNSQAIAESINTINSNLPKGLISLSPRDKQEMLKMGDKTRAFVNKALENAKANPDLVPSYLNLAEMEKDLVAIEKLNNIIRPLRATLDMLEDSSMVAGSESYAAALVFYNSVKAAYKVGVPNAKTIFNDLQERFVAKKPIKETNEVTE